MTKSLPRLAYDAPAIVAPHWLLVNDIGGGGVIEKASPFKNFVEERRAKKNPFHPSMGGFVSEAIGGRKKNEQLTVLPMAAIHSLRRKEKREENA